MNVKHPNVTRLLTFGRATDFLVPNWRWTSSKETRNSSLLSGTDYLKSRIRVVFSTHKVHATPCQVSIIPKVSRFAQARGNSDITPFHTIQSYSQTGQHEVRHMRFLPEICKTLHKLRNTNALSLARHFFSFFYRHSAWHSKLLTTAEKLSHQSTSTATTEF